MPGMRAGLGETFGSAGKSGSGAMARSWREVAASPDQLGWRRECRGYRGEGRRRSRWIRDRKRLRRWRRDRGREPERLRRPRRRESGKRATLPRSISRTWRSAEETASASAARAGARRASKSDHTAASGRGAAMGGEVDGEAAVGERARGGPGLGLGFVERRDQDDGPRDFGEGVVAVIGLRGFDGFAGRDGAEGLRDFDRDAMDVVEDENPVVQGELAAVRDRGWGSRRRGAAEGSIKVRRARARTDLPLEAGPRRTRMGYGPMGRRAALARKARACARAA